MQNLRAGLYYRSIKNQIDEADLERLLLAIDDSKREHILRKRHPEDRIRSLIGISLVEKAALDQNVPDFELSNLVFPEREKPFLSGQSEWSFNVSHSGDHVVCFGRFHQEVGVDVEMVVAKDPAKFKKYFNAPEQVFAAKSPNHFTQMWTAKEAVAKAVGKGIKVLGEIDVQAEKGVAIWCDHAWQLDWINRDDAVICTAMREKE